MTTPADLERQTGIYRGRTPVTKPNATKLARPLDPDRMPWERQPDEPDDCYKAFVAYRDQQKRRVTDHGSSALKWSSIWQWGYRTYEWDRYMARVDVEDQVRYRREMNERHRTIARAATLKIAKFINETLDVEKLRPAEAARWLEVAARLERDASGATVAELAQVNDEPESLEPTLAEVFGGDVDEAKMAQLLAQAMGGRGD